ncbi:MAG: MFS transporter [Bacteroidales bacterium]|nr:MFS transporter [Bacteroidales bacterium]
MNRQKKLAFIAAYSGIFIFGICAVSVGLILPDVITKYSISEIEAGVIASLLPFGILAGSFIFGPVVDRYGYKYLLIFCVLFVILSLEGIAYSENLFLLKSSVFIIGFGGGILNGSTSALVSDISDGNIGANLSILGVYFGIGAFGMPLLIGSLSNIFTSSEIIAYIGFFLFIPVVYFILISFPKPKMARQFPFKEFLQMTKDPVVILIGIFLFFESGVEGITNSWTTTYLRDVVIAEKGPSLFALSVLVLSLTLTRIVLGYVLRRVSSARIQLISICIAAAGALVLMFSVTYGSTLLGLILLGAGFASGFPIFLGYVGELYKEMSGTAFSFVMVIALIGNMIINYLMGVIAQVAGMKHFSSLLLSCLVIMLIVLYFVVKQLRLKIKV